MAKNVTAPRRWQYRPDTEPTQLAYVTQPEIDLLVGANIHGSMDGKPNRGPKGIISLDSGGDWSSPPWEPPQASAAPSYGPHQDAPDQPSDYSGLQASIAEVTPQQARESYQETQNIANQLAQGLTPAQIQAGETVPAGGIVQAVKDAKADIASQPIFTGMGNLWNQYMSGSILTAPWKMLTTPKAKQFSNKNDLAILKAFLSTDGKLDPTKVDKYYEDYKDIIEEGLTGTGGEEDADVSFEEALTSAPSLGVQGTESQRQLDPESYYDRDLYETSGEQFRALEGYPEFLKSMGLSPVSSRFAATTGNLEDIAGIALTGDKNFDRRIIEARAELDRQRGAGGGGGGRIPSLPGMWTDPVDPTDPTPDPIDPTPDPDPTPPTTTPIPFDYSQWPQYAAANQYPWPNYVNQGLGQGPNFDYWNQIARTYPGMS